MKVVSYTDHPELKPEDKRPWWLRLLASLRIRLRPGKSWRRPVSEAQIVGHIDF